MKNLKLPLLPCLFAALLLAASCASSPSTGGGSALDSELMEAVKRNNANRARRLIEAGPASRQLAGGLQSLANPRLSG